MQKKKTKLTKLTTLTIPVPYFHLSFAKEAYRTATQPLPTKLVNGACLYSKAGSICYADSAGLQLLQNKLSYLTCVLVKQSPSLNEVPRRQEKLPPSKQNCSYCNFFFLQKHHEVLCRREQKYKVIRPLLNCSRYSITTMCKQLNLPIYPDKSNQTVQYSRNRIRKQIIPSLQIFFNPQVEDALFKFAEHMIKLRSSVLFDNSK